MEERRAYAVGAAGCGYFGAAVHPIPFHHSLLVGSFFGSVVI